METDSNFIQALLSNAWFNIATAAIALAAAITAVTPSKVDNEWLKKIVSFLNLLGLNVGKAKNADDVQHHRTIFKSCFFFLNLWKEKDKEKSAKKAEVGKKIVNAFQQTDKSKRASRLNAAVADINKLQH